MAYSVRKLAQKWGVSQKHVYKLIHDGGLATFKLGTRRGTRISDEEVLRWERNEKSATKTETLPSENPPDGGLPTSIM